MKTVLILCGGSSEEHEISLISAKGVLDALDRSRYSPLIVGIQKDGAWHLQGEAFFEGDFRADRIRLKAGGPRVSLLPAAGRKTGALLCEGKEIRFDIVFPLLHGTFGEDGTLQGLLDLMKVPYVGSGCLASAIGMDKVMTRKLSALQGVSSTAYLELGPEEDTTLVLAQIQSWGFPVFVKAAAMGSSLGVHRILKPEHLGAAIHDGFRYGKKVLVERAVTGREIECAVLGNGATAKVAIPGEVIPNPKVGWYSYEAKYLMPDGAETRVPADLTPEQVANFQAASLKVYRALGCRGLARVDFFLEPNGQILLSEINTLPGFTPISMYPKMWEKSGLSYSALVTQLLELALAP